MSILIIKRIDKMKIFEPYIKEHIQGAVIGFVTGGIVLFILQMILIK